MMLADYHRNLPTKPFLFVFDDEDLFTSSFCKILRKRGFQVHSATNKKRAFSLIRNNVYDSYLVDIETPWDKTFGLKLIERIKNKNKNANVRVISAHKQYKKKLLDHNIKHFTDKPISDLNDFALQLREDINSTSYQETKPNISDYVVDAVNILHDEPEIQTIIVDIFGKEIPGVKEKVVELKGLKNNAKKLLSTSKNIIQMASKFMED